VAGQFRRDPRRYLALVASARRSLAARKEHVMNARAMSPVDAAWYHIDGPVNSAVVTSALLTRTPLDFERVKAVYNQRLASFERFRQRVVEKGFPLATPHWEDMPDFEIEHQLHHVALPAPGGAAALTELIDDLASTPLDRARPLWDVHVVDGVGGGSALVTRMHHCIGDGMATLQVVRALFDTVPDAPLQRPMVSALATAERRVDDIRATVHDALDAVVHPRKALEHAAALLAGAVSLAGELLKRRDPRSPLKGEFGLRKHVAWSKPVPLKEIKAIGAPLGAKINDVLVAAATGALRTYLSARGVDVDRITLRAMVPVNLRPPEHAQELGNEFGLVVLELAIGCADPLARIRLTRARMDGLKRSPEPAAMLALFNLFGHGPKALEDVAVQLFGSKASLVMTNLAGPTEPLYLAGVPIERAMFWVPHPGRELGMGISILSYCGRATLAVIADAHLVPDPQRIARLFDREFAAMRTAVRKRAQKPAAAKHAVRKRAASTAHARAHAAKATRR
jgi:WS/DGAT/MGAT family acyltransferase